MRTMIVLSISIFSGLIYCAVYAEDSYRSKKADDYFNALKNTCEDKAQLGYATDYREAFFDILKKKPLSHQNFKKLNMILDRAKCDPTQVELYKKQTLKDFLPVIQTELDNIKTDIEEFQKQNLNIGTHLKMYLDLKKEYQVPPSDYDKVVTELKKTPSTNPNRKESCSDVMNLKSPLDASAPKNQDSIGWCYAYTASDLIANATGVNPSSVYMAKLMNSKFNNNRSSFSKLLFKDSTEGGFINLAIDEAINKGICTENDLPSTDYSFLKINPKEVSKDSFVNLKKVIDRLIKIKEMVTDKNLKSKKEVEQLLCDQKMTEPLSELFPNITLQKISQIILDFKTNELFSMLVDTECPIHKDTSLPAYQIKMTHFFDEQKTQLSTIDKQLNEGNIVGIHYKADFLFDYHKTGWLPNHASSIVGRRFNQETQSCEYLLRNSWGKSCSPYSSYYECKDGHVWIAEQFFQYSDTIKQVIYLEEKNPVWVIKINPDVFKGL